MQENLEQIRDQISKIDSHHQNIRTWLISLSKVPEKSRPSYLKKANEELGKAQEKTQKIYFKMNEILEKGFFLPMIGNDEK